MPRQPAVLLLILFFLYASETGAQTLPWSDVSPPAMPSPDSPPLAYDSLRGRTVLISNSSKTWEWDGASWTLRSTVGPSPRRASAMAFDSARGRTVLFGGEMSSTPFTYLGDTWEWDGASWSQVSTTGPAPRYSHAMTFDSGRGRVVLFGGVSQGFSYETWEWDGTAWTLRSNSGAPPRWGHAMAYDANRARVVLFGGYFNSSFLGDTWEWDGGGWSQVSSTGPSPREYHATIYDVHRARVMMFGGWDGAYKGDTWEWNGISWSQRSNSGPPARNLHGLAFDSTRQRAILFGGQADTTFGDTWEWDGTTWLQRSAALPGPHAYTGMSYDSARGRTVLFGGLSRWITVLGDTWEWDGLTWTQRSNSGPSARWFHAMAFDSHRGRTVLYGGGRADTWEWDGSSWMQIQVSGPDSRGAHAMSYDAARGEVLMFGGNYYDENSQIQFPPGTWAYEGTSWIQRASAGPSPRASLAMAFDAVRSKIVLFGGDSIQNATQIFFGDTWEWDGESWEQRSLTGPIPRYAHQMAFDESCQRVVLFGGTVDGTSVLNDTWEWDGSIWTPRSTDGPPRGDFGMAYDSARGSLILFGGIDNSGYRADTWAYSCAKLGDMNRDGIVDGQDIQAFIDAVVSGSADPATIYLADFDGNSSISVDDVAGFTGCLLNQP